MPTLAITNFNIVLSVLGGWISLFGLVSYLCKENFYLSEALISLLAGVAFSPAAANLIRPLEYTGGDQERLDTVTLYFTRLVLGVQLVLAGVQLPSRYLRKEWRTLGLLLGPIMTAMWLATALLVWGVVPGIGFLEALVVGSCVTPTDPVLSNVIVKGRFADHNVPRELQDVIVAESGANDGLGYPFLFLGLYLLEVGWEGKGRGEVVGLWFGETWGYTILLSVVYGAVVGWGANKLLHWAEERKFVDRESFLVFAISLALFIVGTCGMIGSDDVLACFIAGNAFTWDDWFRLETLDDSLQPTVDMLLNVSVFMWLGAVCPWHEFLVNDGVVPLYRLVILGILVLLFRRLPWVFAIHKFIPQIEEIRQAIFVGFFGPVGVSAIFYLYITLEFLKTMEPSEKVEHLGEVVKVVVWFLAICSIVVHGLSIPLGKLGFYLPRTLSRGISVTSDGREFLPPIRSRVSTLVARRPRRNSGEELPATEPPSSDVRRSVYRIGGSVIPRRPIHGEPDIKTTSGGLGGLAIGADQASSAAETDLGSPSVPGRTIRFPDESPVIAAPITATAPGPAGVQYADST
ncbi:putative Na(+)/H(+) antiporter [Triangularia verruculosa]|uniref:Na(+)/H(+) antiporter n=1 Tax=Triangularia verruculosa TaxID=2587418 RepID=A0AAN7APN2_9PEZI|nr:putative Na(+)/H(+) antiporter [Triangularia verruculosa]